MSKQQRSSVLPEMLGQLVVQDTPIPEPKDDQVLVKITAAAVNPVDHLIQTSETPFVSKYPAVLGIDGAGVIEAVGSAVTRFKKGDRVFFQGRFDHIEEATFQQYAIAFEDIISKTPANITDDEAATIPVASLAVIVGLFNNGGIPLPLDGPTAEGRTLLILGGGSSVGQYAIQLARIAGFSKIITTASLTHRGPLEKLGATHVIDRNSGTIISDIKAAAGSDTLSLVFDSISQVPTLTLALDVIDPSNTNATIIAVTHQVDKIVPLNEKRQHPVTIKKTYGSAHVFKNIAVPFWRKVGEWIESGQFVPNRVQVVEGGLDALPSAFELVHKGVSRVKLVIHPQDTV